MFDQPELEALLRANLKRYPHAELRGDVEVTDVTDRGRRPRPRHATPTGSTAASTSSRPTTCSAATAPTAWCAPRSARAMRRSELRAALAGGRRRHRRRPRPVGGRAPGVRSGSRRHLHAHRRYPLPLGVPAAARRDRRGLRAAWRRARPAHRTVGRPRRARRAGAGPRHRVHVPGAARRPLAARQRLPARRRRPPHPAVHRPGHGRRPARRGEPGVEAGRRPRTGPARTRVLDTYEQERKPHARAHDPARARRRTVDDGRRRARQPGSRRIVVPRLHHVPGLRAKVARQHDARAAPLRAGAPVARAAAAGGHAVPQPGSRRRQAARRRRSAPGFALVIDACPSAPSSEPASSSAARSSTSPAPARELAQWLRHGRATAAVIRPDRTVMRAGREVGELCAAVPRVHARGEDTSNDRSRHRRRPGVPARHLHAPAAIVDPYPHYARLRELGAVVWLPRHRRVRAAPLRRVQGRAARRRRRSSPARASRSTPSSTGFPAAPRSTATAPNTTSAASWSRTECCPARCGRSATTSTRRPPPSSTAALAQGDGRRRRRSSRSALPHGGGARPRRLAARRPRQATAPGAAATFDVLGPLNVQCAQVGSRVAADAAVRPTGGAQAQRCIEGSMGHDAAARRRRGQAVSRRVLRR